MLLSFWDAVALLWFTVLWGGYFYYARAQATKHRTLSAEMYHYRIAWMQNIIKQQDSRMQDVAVIQNLSNLGNFLATTAIFIIAGLLTIAASSQEIHDILEPYAPYVYETTPATISFKAMCLVMIFLFAFFRLTWSMRQNSFCAVMLGASPKATPGKPLTKKQQNYAKQMAKISDRASHEFSFGLRAYYYGSAMAFWFVHPFIFMMITTLITMELHRREFRSRVLRYMIRGRG